VSTAQTPPPRAREPLPLRALAPAKINLGLFVGLTRPDGRHELVSVMQSISLADELTLEDAPAGAERDEVVCPGVSGENLAANALELFRQATGWDAGPLRLGVDKRVPVAAGLGGGSADAAATLRLASAASGLGDMDLLHVLAGKLGADVPAQVAPGRWLGTGAGELLDKLPDPVSPLGVLVLAGAAELSTAEVYAAADRMELGHDASILEERRRALGRALELGVALPEGKGLLHNDLQAAAIALCPAIEGTLEQAREAGAEAVFVSGSGPTVVGLFARANGLVRAQRAAAGLAGREPAAMAAVTVDASFGEPRGI
jgi:4-diphosphocytidyl-2-C-methyl-D-erythritol kinase